LPQTLGATALRASGAGRVHRKSFSHNTLGQIQKSSKVPGGRWTINML